MVGQISKKGAERRLYPRRLLMTKVIFEDEYGDGVIWLESEDISAGGIFVSGEIPIKIGSYVFLSFTLPGGARIRATGQIARLAEKRGIGVRFIGLADEAARAIGEFVS